MTTTLRNCTAVAFACILLTALSGYGQGKKFDFAKRHEEIKKRFAQSKGKNKLVHNPPMIQADAAKLADDEPVIGVHVNKEARAYPLAMLFGGGIFELLNDTCGGEPIAVSW